MSPGSKPYLPEKWRDDEYMTAIMSMLKDRSVNPLDYDKKIEFWSKLIAASCDAEKDVVVSTDTLKKRFQRGDRVPACMPQIIQQLQLSSDLISMSSWKSRNSSWLGWGASAVSSWIFGGPSVANEQFVHYPTLKKQADAVLEFFRQELAEDVEGTASIIAFDEMYSKCADIVGNKTNFDLVLDELSIRGEINVASPRGEKVIKFKDTESSGPATFTESDQSVHDIRRTLGVLEKKVSSLENTIKKLDDECRAAVRAGEKTKSLHLLRKKKTAEKELNEKDGQMQRLLGMLHQIASTKHTKEVIDAYKAGASAFKDTLSRHGLSPDKIDETMEDVINTTEQFRDIDEALALPLPFHDSARDTELEDELAALMQGAKKEAPKTPISLPDVPHGALGLPEADATVDISNLERRLNRLREAAM